MTNEILALNGVAVKGHSCIVSQRVLIKLHTDSNLTGVSKQNFRRERMCLTLLFSLQGVKFLFPYILKKIGLKTEAGVAVLYSVGSIVRMVC